MNTNNKILFAICLFLYSSHIFAWNYSFKIDGLYKKNYVQTPEISTIKQIAMSSVNYSTGSVDIRIPLFNIECGDLELPVYLSYNSSGIKVNEPCGWVGQNWYLHAEPMLTRTPRGHIDKSGECDFDFYKDKKDYYWTRIYLNNNLKDPDNMPDEYNFSLLTGGGMFMYSKTENNDKKYVCLPYDDMDISYSGHFTITDPLGTKFEYGGGADQAVSPVMYETAWHASSVTAANGIDRISFKYDNEQNIHIKRHEEHFTVVDNYTPVTSMGYGGGVTHFGMIGQESLETCQDVEELFRMPVIYNSIDARTYSYQLGGNHALVDDGRVIDPIYYYPDIAYKYKHLSEITYLGNKVTFSVDDNGYLHKIAVINCDGQTVKNFILGYETHRDRQYLTDVKELSSEEKIIYCYHLNYYNTGDVTRPGGRAYDFWGYNNSDYLHDYVSLVPKMKLYTVRLEPFGDYVQAVTDSIVIGGAPGQAIKSRHADEYYMQCGMLSSIEHPTGGKETFIWEANKAKIEDRIFNDESSVFRITDELDGENGIYVMGGLRIKEINISENGIIKSRRTFTYGKDGNGAGKTPLRNGPNYFINTQKKIYNNIYIHNALGHSESRCRTISSSPIVPITYYNGASVMYDQVTEHVYSDGNPTIKTVYKYTLPDLNGQELLTQYDVWDFHVHNYSKWFSDHIDSKEVYENTDAGYKLVSSDKYGYSALYRTSYDIRGREYKNEFIEYFSDGELNLLKNITYGTYKDYSVTPKAKVLVSRTHTEYMSNGVNIVNKETYGYDNPSDIRLTSQTITQGSERYCIHTSYPSVINNGIYAEMVNKNMLDYPVEERMERNNKIVSARLMTYAKQGSCFYPDQMYTYTPGASGCLSSKFNTYSGTGVNSLYAPLIKFVYSNGRISRLIDNQGITTSYTWDQYRQFPIQEKKTGGNMAHTRSFTYMPGVGMTSETKPNNYVTTYIYDSAGRLSEIRDCNNKPTHKFSYKYVTGDAIHGQMQRK